MALQWGFWKAKYGDSIHCDTKHGIWNAKYDDSDNPISSHCDSIFTVMNHIVVQWSFWNVKYGDLDTLVIISMESEMQIFWFR